MDNFLSHEFASRVYGAMRQLVDALKIYRKILTTPSKKDFRNDSPVTEAAEVMRSIGSTTQTEHLLNEVIRRLALELLSMDCVQLDLDNVKLEIPTMPVCHTSGTAQYPEPIEPQEEE